MEKYEEASIKGYAWSGIDHLESLKSISFIIFNNGI